MTTMPWDQDLDGLTDVETELLAKLQRTVTDMAGELGDEEAFPATTLEALWREGILASAVPAEYGGGGVSLTATARFIEVASGTSATLGWLLLIQFGLHHLLPTLAGSLAAEYFQKVCDDGALLAGSTSTRALCAQPLAGGGVEITGVVRFASGAPEATWISIPVRIEGSDVQNACVMIQPGDGVTFRPAHYLHTLRGSLSGEIDLDRVVVPAHQVHPFVDLEDRSSRPGCRYFGAWQSLLLQNAVFTGIAYAAVEGTVPQLQARSRLADKTSQVIMNEAIGAAVADLVVSRSLLYWHLASIENASVTHEDHLVAIAPRASLILSEVATRAFSSVNRLVELSGGSVLMMQNSLERRWRDIQLARAAEGNRRGLVLATVGSSVVRDFGGGR